MWIVLVIATPQCVFSCWWWYFFILRLGRSCCQMQSFVVWSQSTVSSSRAAKPSIPFGGYYKGQEASMWSAVCSSAPHLQFAEDTKPHLCIVERNSPTPVRRRFSLTQEGLCRVIPGGEGPGDGINVWRRKVFFCHSIFHFFIITKLLDSWKVRV